MTLVDIVFHNLRRRKGRMALVVVGLAIGAGTVVALRSLQAALEREIGAQLDQFGANIVIVPKSSSRSVSYGGVAVSAATFDMQRLAEQHLGKIRSIPYANRLAIVAPKLLGEVEAEGRQLVLAGIDFREELRMKKWWRISGRAPGDARELLVGYDAARRLGIIRPPETAGAAGPDHRHDPVRGKALELLRAEVTVGGEAFRVSGVLDSTGADEDGLVYATLAEAQRLLGRPGELSVIEVSALCNGCPIDDIVAQIARALPGAKVSAVQQAVRARTETVERLSRFSTAITAVMLVIGSLVVFITMLASVVERTREIGVLRALGFRKTHVVAIFLIEATVISLAGGVLGWAAGTLAGAVSARQLAGAGAATAPSLILALAAAGASVATGIASTLYPALRAAKLDPSESLRYF